MNQTISPCKPQCNHYSYSNESSQGALVKQTQNWPRQNFEMEFVEFENEYGDIIITHGLSHYPEDHKLIRREANPIPVPKGLKLTDAYTDRMQQWDWKKYGNISKDSKCGYLFQFCSDEKLIKFCKLYFGINVVAVRVVHYFNVAYGGSCPRIDVLYKEDNTDFSVEYRDYHIRYNPKPIPMRNCDWDFVHDEYDGPEDNRCGYAESIDAVLKEIDELEGEPEDEVLKEMEELLKEGDE